jgi:hypothetical protein
MVQIHSFLPSGRLFWLLSFLFGVVAAAPPTVVGQDHDTGLRPSLAVEPNAIQDAAKPMTIRVTGIPHGERVHLEVLQDCDGTGRPSLLGTPGCVSPLRKWDSTPAELDGVTDHLDLSALQPGPAIPVNRKLWLRASHHGSSQATYAIFGLVKDPCVLWQSLLDTLRLGPCRLGLAQALLRDRGGRAGPSTSSRFDG